MLFLSGSTFVGVLGAPVELPVSHLLCVLQAGDCSAVRLSQPSWAQCPLSLKPPPAADVGSAQQVALSHRS